MPRRASASTRLNTWLASRPWLFAAIPAVIQLTYIALDPVHAYVYVGVLSEIGLKVTQ